MLIRIPRENADKNEHCKGILRRYFLKGKSLEASSSENVLTAADEINSRPRRMPDYRTAEEDFDLFPDKIYSL